MIAQPTLRGIELPPWTSWVAGVAGVALIVWTVYDYWRNRRGK